MNRYARFSIPSVLGIAIKGVIVILCLYVVGKSVEIIGKIDAKETFVNLIGNGTKLMAQEIASSSNVMTQYMMYVENDQSLSEKARKEMLEAIVSDYILYSEYSYDISDPAYKQVIEVIYENINATQDIVVEETTQVIEEESTNNKLIEIVPVPKAQGKIYTTENIGTFKSVIKNFYTVTSATAIYANDLPLKKALNKKFKITGDNTSPQVLIYHTHSQENFCNSDGSAATSIVGVGDRLTQILTEQFGYNVIHDTSTYDIANGKLDRNEAYEQSRKGIEKILKKYPSISLVIDLHRDGVGEDTKLVTEINGKKTAQIMLFNGMSRFKNTGDIDYLYNPYLFENLALTLQMKLTAETYYPDFTRNNYLNAYQYNLDVMPQAMLVEVGAQTNTYQEAKNAAEPLAVLIDKVLGEE